MICFRHPVGHLPRITDQKKDDAGIRISARGRSLSLAASVLLISALCILLISVSRVARIEESPPIQGVSVFIEDTAHADPHARPESPPRGGIRIATPTTTPAPFDRELLSRALNCSRRLGPGRRADCPSEPLASELGDADRTRATDPNPPDMPPPQVALPGTEPPCWPGLHASRRGAGIEYCARIGPRPPPPSRRPEDICLAGGIGPCHPPEFQDGDVVRRAHTE